MARSVLLWCMLFAAFVGQLEAGPMIVGPPACSIMTMPPEFFTCAKRAPGKYADDKRSCHFYWECGKDGSINHVRCLPPATVFDDRLQKCIVNGEPENITCPIDYGGFQSAGSFCRGRPYKGAKLGKMLDRQPTIQAYYPLRLSDCTSYYWCFIAEGKSHGYRFDCPPGEIFDEQTLTCRESSSTVKCNCGNFTDVA